MEDKLILGGKEFKSRFILGSGKYNLNLINAAVEQGGAEMKIFWIIFQRVSHCFQILLVHEMQRRQFVLRD